MHACVRACIARACARVCASRWAMPFLSRDLRLGSGRVGSWSSVLAAARLLLSFFSSALLLLLLLLSSSSAHHVRARCLDALLPVRWLAARQNPGSRVRCPLVAPCWSVPHVVYPLISGGLVDVEEVFELELDDLGLVGGAVLGGVLLGLPRVCSSWPEARAMAKGRLRWTERLGP